VLSHFSLLQRVGSLSHFGRRLGLEGVGSVEVARGRAGESGTEPCAGAHGTEARTPGSVGSIGLGGPLDPGDGPLVYHPR
jgi:hypothetical protein